MSAMASHQAPASRRCARGMTLVELLVTLSIVAVMVAVALPSMRDLVARKRLEGTAQELITDLRLMKSLPPKPTYPAGIKFASNASLTCYAVYLRGTAGRGDGSCDCTLGPDLACGAAGVGAPELVRVVSIPRSSGITLAASRDVTTLELANDGVATSDLSLQATVEGSGVGSIRVMVNALFSPSMCAASGTFGSLRSCQ